MNNLTIGQTVYHNTLYWGKEPMKVVGLRKDTVELEGDYSGGTHNVCQRDWMPMDGLLVSKLGTVSKSIYPCAWGNVTHLSVKREDGQPIQGWDDLQTHKNKECGEEATAIEVYPAQSELVNFANVRHLWILPKGFELPVTTNVK